MSKVYKLMSKSLLVFGLSLISVWAIAQQRTVTGTVTSLEDEEGIPGVNVLVKGTQRGTVTNVMGEYSIDVADGETLVFSAVGYTTEEIVVGNRSVIDLSMAPDIQQLSEIVVVGYGNQERAKLTSSISTVSSKDFQSNPITNISEAIQGRVAGVNITNSSGAPGAGAFVQIRGPGSLRSTEPIYVVDGVITTSGINSLNPAEIESVSILKDAAAAAIYGARAANGVVLITTKRGQAGETRVDFEAFYGSQTFNKRYDMLNAEQFATINNEAVRNAFSNPDPELVGYYQNPELLGVGTDWQEQMFRDGSIQNYYMNVSGGSENFNFAVSGSYFNNEGIIRGSAFERYSLRINSDANIGKFKIGESLNILWTSRDGRGNGQFENMLTQTPAIPIRDPLNLGGFAMPNAYNVNQDSVVDLSMEVPNPVAAVELVDQNVYNLRLFGNIYGQYEIIPGLNYKLSIGGDYRTGRNQVYTPPFRNGFSQNIRNQLNYSTSFDRNFLIENTLSYIKSFGNHDIDIVAGYTYQEDIDEGLSGSGQELPVVEDIKRIKALEAATENIDAGGRTDLWRIQSFFGRLNYSLQDKYLFSASIRRDASSRFGPENKWGTFPAFSAGWVISQEDFFQGITPISDLKVRASWGQLGNDGIPPYLYYANLETRLPYVFGDNTMLSPGVSLLDAQNESIRWETTTTLDIGIDVSFFDNRLELVADYYKRNTTDLLLQVPLAAITGIVRRPYINIGEIQNSGFELALTYRNSEGPVKYSISGNISTVNNEVVSLYDALDPIVEGAEIGNFFVTRTEEGNSLGQFFGWKTDGIFQSQQEIDDLRRIVGEDTTAFQSGASPGDFKFKDINGRDEDGNLTGEPDGVIDEADRDYIGNPFPDFFYGLNASIAYKGFDFSFLLTGVQGNQIYNQTRAWVESMDDYKNYSTLALERWTPMNPSQTVPRAVIADPNLNNRPSNRWVEDGSYMRLRNLQVGYTFPSNLVNSINMRNLRVYFSAQNLLTITGYSGLDPEVGSGRGGNVLTANEDNINRGIDRGEFPNPVTLTFGIQAGF